MYTNSNRDPSHEIPAITLPRAPTSWNLAAPWFEQANYACGSTEVCVMGLFCFDFTSRRKTRTLKAGVL